LIKYGNDFRVTVIGDRCRDGKALRLLAKERGVVEISSLIVDLALKRQTSF